MELLVLMIPIAAIALLSLVMSLLLVQQDKSNKMYRLQAFFWLSIMASSIYAGIIGEGSQLALASVISFLYLSNVIQFVLMSHVYNLNIHNRPWIKIYLSSVVIGLVCYFVGLPFQAFAMPLCVASALPSYFFYLHIKRIPDKKTFDYFLIGSLLITGIHMLDYPFLRLIPGVAPIGFSIYFALLFVKSVTIPYVILNSNDKSYQKKLKSELEKATHDLNEANQLVNYRTKMSALGEMAGGIAHEINNPLAIILSKSLYIQKLEEKGKLTPELLKEELDQVTETVTQIKKIVKSMRVISGTSNRDSNEYRPTPVSEVVSHPYNLVSEKCRSKNIVLELNMPDSTTSLEVICNQIEISQVLLNLLNNSIDAIEEPHNQDKEKWVKIDISEGLGKVEFRVTDSGAKVSKDLEKKLFQPFFTTKDVGKGTGLGLSLSSKLIAAHDSELCFDQNNGTPSFSFELKQPEDKKAAA